ALIIMDQKLVQALLGLLQAALIIGLVVTLMLKGRETTLPEGDPRRRRRRREDRPGGSAKGGNPQDGIGEP
ncbi:MAG: hypothetical protein V1758_16585, partial [Pseudomonadota bacterium]